MIVIDTNVLLSGLLSSKGYSFWVLEQMLEGKIDYLISLKLLNEYREIVMRQENLRLIPLTLMEVESVLALITQNASFKDVYFRWRPNLKDENDNFLMELAIAGNAESIVTFNKKDFTNTELKFDLIIETPREFYLRRKNK